MLALRWASEEESAQWRRKKKTLFKHDSHRINCKWSFRCVCVCVCIRVLVGFFSLFLVKWFVHSIDNWLGMPIYCILFGRTAIALFLLSFVPIMILAEWNKGNSNVNDDIDETTIIIVMAEIKMMTHFNEALYYVQIIFDMKYQYAVVVRTSINCMTNGFVDCRNLISFAFYTSCWKWWSLIE